MIQFTIRLAGPIERLDARKRQVYHNTAMACGKTLSEYIRKAAEQDNEVLDIIDRLGGSASPSQVWRAVSKKWPITSCRRAMTNLTNAGKLVKTGEKRAGEYGRAECVWRMA